MSKISKDFIALTSLLLALYLARLMRAHPPKVSFEAGPLYSVPFSNYNHHHPLLTLPLSKMPLLFLYGSRLRSNCDIHLKGIESICKGKAFAIQKYYYILKVQEQAGSYKTHDTKR